MAKLTPGTGTYSLRRQSQIPQRVSEAVRSTPQRQPMNAPGPGARTDRLSLAMIEGAGRNSTQFYRTANVRTSGGGRALPPFTNNPDRQRRSPALTRGFP